MEFIGKLEGLLGELKTEVGKVGVGNKSARTRARVKLMDLIKACKQARIDIANLPK